MALIVHSSSCLAKKPHRLLHSTPLLPSPTKPTVLFIKSQDDSTEPPNPTITGQSTDDNTSSGPAPPLTKPSSSGLGFGSSSSSSSSGKSSKNPVSTKKKQRGGRERASVIRRTTLQKPGFISQSDEAQSKEQSRNESSFLLAWLGLGLVILIQGILLAASADVWLSRRWFIKWASRVFNELDWAEEQIIGMQKELKEVGFFIS
uniref:Uncharacterized protein n=1 Tax=Davidia involucrata TaxID=16924 RepID=A0A5B6ZS44_DAVIN